MAVPFIPQPRWLAPVQGGFSISTSSQAASTAGRVYLALFDVAAPTTVDQITLVNGGTAAGNIRVAIYGPVVTEETCEGARLVVESASVAQSGTSAGQSISLAPTLLQPGRYYIGIQFSDTTATFFRQGANTIVTGFNQFYDRSGGFGAFTSPCPAVTNTSTAAVLRVRCI